jgi:hypothetical protein
MTAEEFARFERQLKWTVERRRARDGLPPKEFTTAERERIRSEARLAKVVRGLELQAIREWTALEDVRRVYRDSGVEVPAALTRDWPEIRRDLNRGVAAARATLGRAA